MLAFREAFPRDTYHHRLPERGDNLHVHPLSGRVLPVQVLAQALVEVVGHLSVAEADHKAVLVRGWAVDRVQLDHRAFDLSLPDGPLLLVRTPAYKACACYVR